MAFSYEYKHKSSFSLYALEGRFVESTKDMALVGVVCEELLERNVNLIIDLGKMAYINSVGINALVRIVKEANNSHKQVVFVNVPERVMGLLEVIKLNSVFTIRKSLEEGVSYLEE
jgi:anti-anti-sigma factor